jgi:hypothetical protein
MQTSRTCVVYTTQWYPSNQVSQGVEMKNKRNWAQYNQSLVNRGNITFWFSDDVLASWNHPNHDYRRGRPFVYSDTAIETLLVVREVFHLTYRSTEGFGRNIFSLLGVQDARIPDYTSLCKRSKR